MDSSEPGQRDLLRHALRPSAETICPTVPVGNVDLLRPFGLSRATQERVLLLESDERVCPALRLALPELVGADGYVVPRKELASGGYSYHLRLYRRTRTRYSGRSHAFPVVEGRVEVLPRELHIEHHIPRPKEYWHSADRARRYLLSDFLERPYDRSYLEEAAGRASKATHGEVRALSNPQILLAHLLEALRELLRSGSPGLARLRWEHGRVRRAYVRSLSEARRAWLLEVADQVRKAGGLTRFLGMDDVEYVEWLSSTD